MSTTPDPTLVKLRRVFEEGPGLPYHAQFVGALADAVVAHLVAHLDDTMPTDDDDLYLCLKGAREAFCLAQLHVGPDLSNRIDKAVSRIDAIGSERLPNWAKSDCSHVPNVVPPSPTEVCCPSGTCAGCPDPDYCASLRPTDDLPDGVWRAPGDDRLFAFRRDLAPLRAAGWTVHYTDSGSEDRRDRAENYPRSVVEVRPPAPKTEWVPWWEAVGRRLPSGDTIGNVEADHSGPLVFGRMGERVTPNADGKVEVQVQS